MCQQKWLKYIDVTEETLTSLNRASIPVVRIWVSDGLTRASCMICLDSEARHLKQRPFSGLVNKNTGAGYSPIISVLCVNVAISKTSRTFKSVFFIRCRRSDSSIFVDKWNLASATIARSFSQRPQAATRQLRAWPRIHVQPRFQQGFRNGVTFLRVVYGPHSPRYEMNFKCSRCTAVFTVCLLRNNNGFTPKHISHRIWITMVKSFLEWVPVCL